MDLGVLLQSPRGVSPRLEWGIHVRFPPELKQQCHASLCLDQGICGFPSRLSHEAFPRGFPTGLYQVPPWCESILGLKVEAVQGKEVSLEWTETSGGLWEWCHDPGLVGKTCGKASWERLVGKPRGKATDPLIHAKESVTLLLQLGRKEHVHAPTRDED